jgi:integrase
MPKLTARSVETIKPSKKRQELPDTLLPGLYFIVQPSGAKSWAVRYRHHGRTRKYTFGSYPRLDLKAARELGGKALRAVAEGRDPTEERREARPPKRSDIASAFADFLTNHTRKKNGDPVRESTRRERARLFGLKRDPANADEWIKTGNGVLKRWKGRNLDSISKGDIRDLIRDTAKAGPVLANRVLDVLKTFFNWCVKNDKLVKSPCDGIDPPSPKKSGKRVLSDDELRLTWIAAEKMGPPFGPMVQVLILTGQRRSEVAEMERGELDLRGRLWSLPPARAKNNRAHTVPLAQQVIAIIERVPRIGSRFVFTTNGEVAASDFGKRKRKLDALLPKDMAPWCLHDLRRTVASGMAKLGVSLPVVEKVLNHISGSFSGIVAVYQQHDFAEEKRAALEAWATHVESLISAKPRLALLRGER